MATTVVLNGRRSVTVPTWSKDELSKIAEADDLHISPFRDDGVTYGTPTWIWCGRRSMVNGVYGGS